MIENADIFDFTLTDDEVKAISGLNTFCTDRGIPRTNFSTFDLKAQNRRIPN